MYFSSQKTAHTDERNLKKAASNSISLAPCLCTLTGVQCFANVFKSRNVIPQFDLAVHRRK